jgi:hypothetical protein
MSNKLRNLIIGLILDLVNGQKNTQYQNERSEGPPKETGIL